MKITRKTSSTLCVDIHGMRERGETGYGMVTMCIGTGMGAAGLIEVL